MNEPSETIIGEIRRLEKNSPVFWKSIQNSCPEKKCQNIYIELNFKSPNHLQQTTFETLKYLQQIKF